jgi:hypothetical protein
MLRHEWSGGIVKNGWWIRGAGALVFLGALFALLPIWTSHPVGDEAPVATMPKPNLRVDQAPDPLESEGSSRPTTPGVRAGRTQASPLPSSLCVPPSSPPAEPVFNETSTADAFSFDMDDAVMSLRASGFECRPSLTAMVSRVAWSCDMEGGGMTEYSVVFDGPGGGTIRAIRAEIARSEGAPSDLYGAMFLGSVAALDYDGGNPRYMRQWVIDHVASGGQIDIGSVRFELSGAPRRRTLTMTLKSPASHRD